MAIKINLESTVIPVEIGDLKFQIDVTDETYERYVQAFNSFLDDVSELDETTSEDLTLLKAKQRNVYDVLLGEGAFESIYELAPSVVITTGILTQVVEQLEKEMMKRLDGRSIKAVPKKKITKIK